MGWFIEISGIANAPIAEVETALKSYAERRSGVFAPAETETATEAKSSPNEMLVLAESEQGHVTVQYPDAFLDWDNASQYLSKDLNRPVFSLHIHDSDLWMYRFFVNGQEVDRFNPTPDYWGELSSPEELQSWAGDANMVCAYWPNVQAAQIVNYLVPWDFDDEDDDAYEVKAYPEDASGRDDWQMFDFMDKLGLAHAMDERGDLLGRKYYFTVNPE